MLEKGKTTTDRLRDAGEALRASGAKAAEQGSTLGMAMIDQAESNAREAFAAMRKAAQAKDLTELMRIQGDYMRDQGTRSMNQAREIADMIAKFGREAMAPVTGKKE